MIACCCGQASAKDFFPVNLYCFKMQTFSSDVVQNGSMVIGPPSQTQNRGMPWSVPRIGAFASGARWMLRYYSIPLFEDEKTYDRLRKGGNPLTLYSIPCFLRETRGPIFKPGGLCLQSQRVIDKS